MTFKSYEDIEAWQRGISLAELIYRITSEGKFGKDWSLRDRVRRAAVSIPSNLAEGFERESDAEFRRFVLISKGSCGELRAQLMLTGRIGYLPSEETADLTKECSELFSMLSGLSKYLRRSINNVTR